MRTLLVAMCLLAACRGGSKQAANGKRIQITYDIDLDPAVDRRASEVRRDLEAQLAEQKVDAKIRVNAMPLGSVTVVPADPAKRSDLDALIEKTYGSSLAPCEAPADPNALCFKLADSDAIKKAALDRATKIVKARIVAFGVDDATVTAKGEQLVVELPGLAAEQLAGVEDVIGRTAALAFEVVDNNSDYMKRLFAHVGSTKGGSATDPDAAAAEIEADVDQWRLENGGSTQVDYYLRARDREASVSPEQAKELHCLRPESCRITGRAVIERYVHELARHDPSFAPPDDRMLAFERIEPAPEAEDRRTYWRTYYVDRESVLTGAAIADAKVIHDPYLGVMLEFDRDGAHAFGELTTRIVGKKLATILDGTVHSAPIINGPIRGGRASITLGSRADERTAKELALVLRTGALPGPMIEDSITQH